MDSGSRGMSPSPDRVVQIYCWEGNEMLGDNLRWFSFLYFALWLVLKTCATFSTNQIQAKTNNDLVACVFPRFRSFGWFYFEFSFSLYSRCGCWFWFYDFQWKRALKATCFINWQNVYSTSTAYLSIDLDRITEYKNRMQPFPFVLSNYERKHKEVTKDDWTA